MEKSTAIAVVSETRDELFQKLTSELAPYLPNVQFVYMNVSQAMQLLDRFSYALIDRIDDPILLSKMEEPLLYCVYHAVDPVEDFVKMADKTISFGTVDGAVKVPFHVDHQLVDKVTPLIMPTADRVTILWEARSFDKLDRCVEVIDELDNRKMEFRFVITGSPAVKARIALHHLKNIKVFFLEALPYKFRLGLYKGVDVVVDFEEWSYPRTFVYAGAAAKPMISFSNQEVIEHGENGFVVRDVEECVNLIILLANDVKLREKIGKSAHRLVADRFTTEKVAKRFFDIYTRREEDEN